MIPSRVGALQILVFLTPIAAGYAFFRDKLAMPDLDLSTLSFEPGAMIVGALLLLAGFTVFTGVLVAIGAIMPTAKDAGTIFGPLMALIFVPFYAMSLIISNPHAPIVQIFTYFPLSAPVTALLRNGFGTLTPLEATIIIAELFLVGFLILRLAVHLFRYGSIQYSSKLSIAGTFRKTQPTHRKMTAHGWSKEGFDGALSARGVGRLKRRSPGTSRRRQIRTDGARDAPLTLIEVWPARREAAPRPLPWTSKATRWLI